MSAPKAFHERLRELGLPLFDTSAFWSAGRRKAMLERRACLYVLDYPDGYVFAAVVERDGTSVGQNLEDSP